MTLPKTSDEHSKLHLIYIEYKSETDATVQRALRKATSHQPSNLAISLCFGHFSSFSLGTYGWPYHTLPQSARTANSEAKDGQKTFTSPLQTVHLSKVAWLKPFGRRIQTQVKIIKKRTLTDMSKDFCEQMQAHVKNAHDSSMHHLYVSHVSHYKRQKTHIEVVSTTGMTNLSTQHCEPLKLQEILASLLWFSNDISAPGVGILCVVTHRGTKVLQQLVTRPVCWKILGSKNSCLWSNPVETLEQVESNKCIKYTRIYIYINNWYLCVYIYIYTYYIFVLAINFTIYCSYIVA